MSSTSAIDKHREKYPTLSEIDSYRKVDRLSLAKQIYKNPRLFDLLFPKMFFIPRGRHHNIWQKALDNQKYPYLNFIAPRFHSKTTYLAEREPMFNLAYRLKHNIYIISATESQAKDRIKTIRDNLEHNSVYTGLYGLRLTQRSTSALEINNSMLVRGKGATQEIRGAKYKNWRPDLVICDDLMTDMTIYSKTQRRRVIDWFTDVVLPLPDPITGRIIVIGTRMHQEDLLGKLLRNKAWHSIVMRATHNGRLDGEPLWPEVFNRAKLYALYQNMKALSGEQAFWREMMQDTSLGEENLFKVDDLRYYMEADFDESVKKIEGNYFIGVDPASTYGIDANKDNDDTAVALIFASVDGKHYIRSMSIGKFDPGQVIDIIMTYARMVYGRLAGVAIEATAYQRTLAFWLESRMLRDGISLRIFPITVSNKIDKTSSLAGIAPMFQAGNVFVPTERKEWVQTLKDQMREFPGGHDDTLDSIKLVMMAEREAGLVYKVNSSRSIYNRIIEKAKQKYIGYAPR